MILKKIREMLWIIRKWIVNKTKNVIMPLGKINYVYYEYQEHDWKGVTEMKR